MLWVEGSVYLFTCHAKSWVFKLNSIFLQLWITFYVQPYLPVNIGEVKICFFEVLIQNIWSIHYVYCFTVFLRKKFIWFYMKLARVRFFWAIAFCFIFFQSSGFKVLGSSRGISYYIWWIGLYRGVNYKMLDMNVWQVLNTPLIYLGLF